MRRLAAVAVLLLFSLNVFAQEPAVVPQGTPVSELRLGVICYGGVSLAIYMYGTARELHHLAMASAALDCDADGASAVCGSVPKGSAWKTLPPSARPYYDELVAQALRDGVRTRVVIDVISGTSAGGINGIFLAKALTHNGPLDRLRDIWFEQADVSRLATRKPWKFWILVNLLRGEAALGGTGWLKELYAALNKIDDAPASGLPTLLAPEQDLDLLVTSTDFYGSTRTLEIGDPATTEELRFDQVYRFSAKRQGGALSVDDFRKANNAALAFAARSSASFPVAFPAINAADLQKTLGLSDADAKAVVEEVFADRLAELREQKDAAAKLTKNLYLVDGGVLNNYPFGIAYARVSKRTPRIQTRRVFVYLEPSPGSPRDPDLTFDAPGALQMFWQAKASIPGKQPITDDILAIGEHNRSVDRVLDIVREDEARAKNEYQGAGGKAPSVARRIEDMLEEKGYGRMALAKPLALSAARGPIAELRAKIEEDAAGNVPIMEESYTRLRVQSVLEQFTRVLNTRLCKMPEGYAGRQSALARAVVMEWAKRKKLTGVDIDRTARKAFLDAFDLGYHRRKLRFVNDWLNKQYEPGGYGIPRDLIQQAQEVLVKRINALSALMIADDNFETFGLGNKVDLARAVVCKPAKGTANDQAKELLDNSGNLKALDDFALGVEAALPPRVEAILAALFDDFIQQTAKWNNPIAARAVLARYLGFPYWDRASYPYTAFSGLGDLTHVDIVRFSPDDTDAISKKGANKLVGIGLGHFKAFLDANGRQTDYLWGRLDGAQRVLGLLGIKADDDPRLTKTFDAIVSEEEADVHGVKPANLTKIKDCVSHKTQC